MKMAHAEEGHASVGAGLPSFWRQFNEQCVPARWRRLRRMVCAVIGHRPDFAYRPDMGTIGYCRRCGEVEKDRSSHFVIRETVDRQAEIGYK